MIVSRLLLYSLTLFVSVLLLRSFDSLGVQSSKLLHALVIVLDLRYHALGLANFLKELFGDAFVPFLITIL